MSLDDNGQYATVNNLFAAITLAQQLSREQSRSIYISQPHPDGGYYTSSTPFADEPYLVVHGAGARLGCDACELALLQKESALSAPTATPERNQGAHSPTAPETVSGSPEPEPPGEKGRAAPQTLLSSIRTDPPLFPWAFYEKEEELRRMQDPRLWKQKLLPLMRLQADGITRELGFLQKTTDGAAAPIVYEGNLFQYLLQSSPNDWTRIGYASWEDLYADGWVIERQTPHGDIRRER